LDVPVQGVVADAKPSAGQVFDMPSQLSATSHCPADWRQMVVAGCFLSVQPGFIPSHLSSTSQTPADWRQTVPALPGVWTHCACSVPLLSTTWQLSIVQTSLSSQFALIQGFIWGVTVRGVQSHFDPVPAC
jgi:hypothetical protein